jgi:hypothetical protein
LNEKKRQTDKQKDRKTDRQKGRKTEKEENQPAHISVKEKDKNDVCLRGRDRER